VNAISGLVQNITGKFNLVYMIYFGRRKSKLVVIGFVDRHKTKIIIYA